MNHEFRESHSDARYCGACGQPYALCRGTKPIDLAFLKEQPQFAPDAGEWDRWCQEWSIDPNTPDERMLDDYLHGRRPRVTARRVLFPFDWEPELSRRASKSQVNLRWRDDAQREWYAACEAFSAAYQRFPLTTRRLQDRAEVVELERLYRLSSSGQEPRESKRRS